MIKHALGWVSGQNHPIVALSQHRPKSPGATGQIQYQPRLTGHLERTPDQTPLAPLRPPTHHALRAHLLAHLRNAPPDAALHAAARAQGVRLSLLSDYDLTGSGSTAPGTFVLGYGSLADDACPSVGETLKKLCTAARDSSLRV